jgi:hypothetical protein
MEPNLYDPSVYFLSWCKLIQPPSDILYRQHT